MAASSLAMRRLFSHRVGVSRVVQQLTLKTVAQGGVARWHSTIPANGATIDASEAPSTRTVPQLKQVKSLPYVGSVLPFYSDVPSTIEQPYEFWPEMRRRHGDFYSMGLPNMGDKSDSRSIIHVVTDPKEMFKVVRSGGAYPSGLISSFWPNIKWSKENKLALVDGNDNGLFGQGEDWKRLRTFLQTDLLHPEAARGYIPGMLKASKLASNGAPASSDELNSYLSRVSFDLFSTIMFGEYTKTADKTVTADPENIKFVEGTIQGLSNAIQILFDPYETVMGNVLQVRTAKYQRMSDGLDIAWDIGQKKIHGFLHRLQNNELTENEKASYLARAIERQATEKSNVSVQEVLELAWTGLFAAVDTTSASLGWNLINIAINPDVQEKLHAEIASVVAANDGVLTETSFSKDSMPFLHAVLRETHRLTPASAISIMKTVGSDEIEIHGTKLNKGAVVALEGFSMGVDPQLMDEPQVYKPERWLPDAVAARTGTPAEVLDHPFLKEPFSAGPRRCPGSRVATNEMLVFLAQLIFDWKISAPTVSSLKDIKYEQRTSIEAEIPPLKFEPRN
jgi:cytochrome P450